MGRWGWLILIGLALILALLLWMAPGERTLGDTVKLVYLHGALVRTAILLLTVSLPLNIVAILTTRKAWAEWGTAIGLAAVIVWLFHTIASVATTYAAWGIPIAWFEPRTRFTFMLAGVAVIVVAVSYLVGNVRFTAGAFSLLALLALLLMPRLGLVQHPVNPIGSSGSNAIHQYYTAILLACLVTGGWLAVLIRHGLSQGLSGMIYESHGSSGQAG